MTGRGVGRGWKVLAWRGGRSVLFSLLPGQFHPPRWPRPSTCAKECAWERRPERREGQQSCGHPEAAHRSTWRCRATMLSLKLPQLLRVHQVPRLLPDDQRDRQHLDSLPAHLVLPVAPPGAGGRPGLPVGALPLAAARLPAARLPLPVCVVLRAHLQLHVTPRASHLLLPGLRRAQPLQPGFPELESPALSKILRTAAFTYPFLFDNLPLFYRLGLCWGRGHSCGQEALSTSHGYHLFCALLTGFLFASHLPERLAPGRFDYIGHSHQLFHICAVMGTHFQLEAVLADMGSRRAWLAMQEPPLGLAGTVATLGLAVAGNLLIIAAFTASLFRAPSACPLLQGGPLEGNARAKLQ
ncbi:membrane progestin receptor delta isoform 3-T3 [Megaptera novaeangliae]